MGIVLNSIEYVVRAYIPIKAIEAFKGNHLDGNLCRLIYDMTEEEAFLPNIQVKKSKNKTYRKLERYALYMIRSS